MAKNDNLRERPSDRISIAHLRDAKKDKIDFLFEIPPEKRKAAAIETDWFDATTDNEKNYFAHGPHQSWAISLVDHSDKKSEGFSTCAGVLITARDTEGRVVSQIVHAYHEKVLPNGIPDESFKSSFEDAMQRFKTDPSIEPRTTDAVIFGGKFPLEDAHGREARTEISRQRFEYLRIAAWLGDEIRQTLGFIPRAIGPNDRVDFTTDAYFLVDAIGGVEHGRLYIVPEQLRRSSVAGADLSKKLFLSFPVRNAEQIETFLDKYVDEQG